VRSNVEPEVAAIALVALIESAATSWLTQDQVFVGLGRRRFVVETTAIAERIVGGDLSPARKHRSRRATGARR
jgi:hypothetical protein